MKHVVILIVLVAALAALSFSGGQTRPPAERMRPALVVIDIQNAFLPYFPEADRARALETIGGIIGSFRSRGFPVVRVYHVEPGEGPQPGTEAFAYPSTVPVLPEDPQVIKNYGNAFRGTDLEKILRAKGVNTVFLCGLSATDCVLATYFGALDRDFKPFTLRGALIGRTPELAHYTEEATASVGGTAMAAMLDNSVR